VGPSAVRTFVVGVAFIAVMIGALVFAVRANGGLPVGEHTTARVAFRDVGPLLQGDEVRMNSLRIGRVAQIRLDNDRAVVTLEIDGEQPIYKDARAELMSRSGLGTKFVDLDPGTPAAGPLGDEVLDARNTQSETELDDVLGVFDPGTREALAAGIRDLGAGAAGHGQDLQTFLAAAPSILPNTAVTAEALASREAAFPELLASGLRLSSRFTGREDHISELVRQFDSTVRAIAVDQGQPLAKTLDALPDTLDHADRAFRDLAEPLGNAESALTNLEDGAKGLGEATPDVRGVLTEGPRPLHKVPGFSDQAVPALGDLEKTSTDLRPLVSKVATALDRAQEPLEVLSPYSKDIALFWVDVNSAIAQGDGVKHYLRLLPLGNSEYVSGVVPGVGDPTVNRTPYPAPNEVRNLHKSSVLGKRQ
jgi:phospholipid/cholesterol/gamma-HCH transport system substrate-binding protein